MGRLGVIRNVARLGLLALLGGGSGAALVAQPSSPPPTYPVFEDNFEADSLENWVIAEGSPLGGGGGGGVDGGVLTVVLDANENHLVRGSRRNLARADEAYLTFSLDLAQAAFPDPGSGHIRSRSIRVAAIQGPDRKLLVALFVRETALGYEAFLGWQDANGDPQNDFATGSFSLPVAGEVTIGYRTNDWVGSWLAGSSARVVEGVTHDEPYASVIEIGKTNESELLTPTGSLTFDDVEFHLPRFTDLWVDRESGDDALDGTTAGTAFATISRASDLAGAGTVVHILPGTYREAVVPAQGGLPGEPAVYLAEDGFGTVRVRGSEPASSLVWTQLQSNPIGLPDGVAPQSIWWADLSSWELEQGPRFVVETEGDGTISSRLPRAREPDWSVSDPFRYSQSWWLANGGAYIPFCNPATDPDNECDLPARSTLQLNDDEDDPNVEPGNLSTLGTLVGADLVARDAFWGHRLYRRQIVAHDIFKGRVTVDEECFETDGDPGLGWGSAYYVEGHPGLLDSPGEWWFDPESELLYLWPPSPGDPAGLELEISRLEVGVDLQGLSHVSLNQLDLGLFNATVVSNQNEAWQMSMGNSVTASSVTYGERGVRVSQEVAPEGHLDKRIESFVLEESELAHLDFEALRVAYFWGNGSSPVDWTRPGTFDSTIRNNRIYDVGFRPSYDTECHAAVILGAADRVTFEGNTISDVAHNGLQVLRSIIHSESTRDFAPEEIKTGELLIKDNTFERACLLKNDCGGARVLGIIPDSHVFRDLLFIGNTFRDNFGWSWSAEQRGLWPTAQLVGAGGMGLYLDNVSNIHVYRNIFYNNGFAGLHLAANWRDGKIYIHNNVSADNAWGVHMGGLFQDLYTNIDTNIGGNIFVNNKSYGVKVSDLDLDYTNTVIDNNLYYNNGWGGVVRDPGAMKIAHQGWGEFFQTVAEIATNTPFESSGQEVAPKFVGYDINDHDLFDGSWADFRLWATSPAVDAAGPTLPPSLSDLLVRYGLFDPPIGPAYDQGAFEETQRCLKTTVADRTITDTETIQACQSLTLGPDLLVESGAHLSARAGHSVILTNGVGIVDGARLEVESNVVAGPQTQP